LDILLREAKAKSQVSVEIDKDKLRKVDVPVQTGNNDKVFKQTSWSPAIPRERMLRELIAFWRLRLAQEKS
jgi:GDP-D-mannose dehydratase